MAGSNLVVVRLSNRGLPPFFGAGIRFLLASLLLFGWVFARRIPLPTRQELPGTVLFGLLGFAGFFAFTYWALVYLPAEGAVVVKKLPTGPPVPTNAVAMLVGSVILLVLSALYGERWSLPADASTWGALAYLVIVGSVAFFLVFLWTIRRWTASGMSFMFVLMPVVATALGLVVLDEPITPAGMAGGLLVLVGVYVGALSGTRWRSRTLRG